jgi:drug/metabolite transporter (DMT)-like permease
MNWSAALTYVAGLSVATERVTELLKRIPYLSNLLSKRRDGTLEDIRVMAVQLLATLIGMVICHSFPTALPNVDQGSGNNVSWAVCLGYGLLASGGSGFWNSALDTFRGVKQKMGS